MDFSCWSNPPWVMDTQFFFDVSDMKMYFLLSVYISAERGFLHTHSTSRLDIILLHCTKPDLLVGSALRGPCQLVTRVRPGRGTWLRLFPNGTDSQGSVSQGTIVRSFANASQNDSSLGVCSFYQNPTAEHADRDSAHSCRESAFHQSFCLILT